MFPTRNGDVHSESSSSSSMGKPVDQHKNQHAKQDETEASYDDGSHTSISALHKLTLSDNPPEEIPMSSQNRLPAAAVYLPHTLDDSPIFPGRNGRFGQQIGNNRGMTYYSPISPSPYTAEHSILDMGQIYPPNLFSSHGAANLNPNLDPYACNMMQSPAGFSPGIGYQFPNNVTFPGLASLHPQIPVTPIPAEEKLITADMLGDILKNPYAYMTDSILNRPLSTLLIRCRTTKFIDEFVQAITKDKHLLVYAACNFNGTCVLQTLIKVAKKRPIIERVPQALADATVYLMNNQSGMHVVKQCFIELEDQKYVPLFEKMMENHNWVYIAKNKHGCRGLNECLDYMVDRFKSLLLTGIAVFARHLALDIYGTYVVQHVIDLRTIHTEHIVKNILPFLEILITIKNGSHLVEKCLETSYSSLIIKQLLDSNKVVKYALHECANYVIQKAIKRTRGRDSVLHERLIKVLSRERNALQVNKHGKYVAKLLPNQ